MIDCTRPSFSLDFIPKHISSDSPHKTPHNVPLKTLHRAVPHKKSRRGSRWQMPVIGYMSYYALSRTHERKIQPRRTLVGWFSIYHRTLHSVTLGYFGGGRLRQNITWDSGNVFNLNINLRTIGWRVMLENPPKLPPFLKRLSIDSEACPFHVNTSLIVPPIPPFVAEYRVDTGWYNKQE